MTLWDLLSDLHNRDQPYRFGECRIAFEVNLRSREHSHLHNPDYSPKPYADPPFEPTDYVLHHIYLNLESMCCFTDNCGSDLEHSNRSQMPSTRQSIPPSTSLGILTDLSIIVSR